MKIFAIFILIAFGIASCKSNNSEKVLQLVESNIKDSLNNQVFNKDWNRLTQDFMTWYNYTYYNVKLSEDFIGLDIDSQKISKLIFLQNLVNKNVVAFKTKLVAGKSVYKLFSMNSEVEDISATSKQNAELELSHFLIEGNTLPNYNFKDLNGNIFNKENTKGKILVLKCWFIGCTACVAEFPKLNILVEENKDNKKVVFVSLAFDEEMELNKFLKTKAFKYATISNTKEFVIDKLNVTQFPTHILIDKNGKIKKVVNKIEDLLPFLQMEIEKIS